MALESSKLYIFQKGYVLRCLVSKFDKKSKRKCPKLLMRNCKSLHYKAVSVNLNIN